MDHFSFLCPMFLMLSQLFIAALCLPAMNGLTSWLLFVMFIVFYFFPMWYPGSGVVLDCIFSDICHLFTLSIDIAPLMHHKSA